MDESHLTKHLVWVKGAQERGICCSAGEEKCADRLQIDGGTSPLFSQAGQVFPQVPNVKRPLFTVFV